MSIGNENRWLKLPTGVSFVVAAMIGTGVFTSLGFQLVDIKSVFALLMLWVIGAAISFCGALTYGELGVAMPNSGGEYNILTKILHPSIGFSAGLVSATVGFTAPAVLASMALGNYFSVAVPYFDPKSIAVFVVIMLHLLHMNSIKIGTAFQNWTTSIKLAIIIIIIMFGFLIDNTQDISLVPKYNDFALILSPNFAVSLVWVSYAYTGWNSVIYVAGEIKNPKKNIPLSMLIGTALVAFLYVLLNYIFLRSTPIQNMEGQIEIGYISGVFIFGESGAKIISFGISIILLSTISSYVFIGPRIIQAMGKNNAFIHFFDKRNENGIPIRAFCLQLVLSLIFIFSSTFEQVLMYVGITLIITTTLTVASLFILRRRAPKINTPYRAWGYPFTPLIFMLTNLWILFYTFKEKLVESSIGAGIFLISIFIYYLPKINFNQKNKQI